MIVSVLRWLLSPLTGEDYVRDVPVAPEALVNRLRATVNRPPKRALGILKVGPHWVGVVTGREFAVWERQQHALRAVGTIRARRGGSRVQARLVITRRTWILMAALFVLFVFGSFGLLTRPDGIGLGPTGLSIAALGGLVMLTVFWSSSLRQRAALKAFLNEVFAQPT